MWSLTPECIHIPLKETKKDRVEKEIRLNTGVYWVNWDGDHGCKLPIVPGQVKSKKDHDHKCFPGSKKYNTDAQTRPHRKENAQYLEDNGPK